MQGAVVGVAAPQEEARGEVKVGAGLAEVSQHRACLPGGLKIRGDLRGQGLNSHQGGRWVQAAVRAHGRKRFPTAAGAVW